MLRSRVAMILPMAIALTLGSCSPGDGPPLYPVHGKVIFNGQAAAGATVVFQREDAPPPPPNAAPLIPIGLADEDGNFSLTIDDVGHGAPAGKYKVLIQWLAKAEGKSELEAKPKKGGRRVVADKPEMPPDRLKGRYMKVDSPRFHVEIKPEPNNLEPFDVSN